MRREFQSGGFDDWFILNRNVSLWSFMVPRNGFHPLVLRVAERLVETFVQLEGIEVLEPPEGLGFRSGESEHWYQLDEEKMVSTCLHLQSHAARKVHLEVSRVGPAFGYIHAMVFPRHHLGLPLFGVDVNATPKKVTLSVLHLYPSPGEEMPPQLEAAKGKVEQSYFEKHRPLPEWGEVFRSGVAVIVQPKTEQEEQAFSELVSHFVDAYAGATADPPTASEEDVRPRQHAYSLHKRRNRGGTKVLQNALGAARGERYVDEFLWPLEV